jgi:hypothetical protein
MAGAKVSLEADDSSLYDDFFFAFSAFAFS